MDKQEREKAKNDVKRKTNINNLLADHGVKVPRNRKIRCLFHNEKSPSFHIYDDHGYCYSCIKRADAIEITMALRDCSFKEALQYLADKAGVSLVRENVWIKNVPQKKQEKLYTIAEREEMERARKEEKAREEEKNDTIESLLSHYHRLFLENLTSDSWGASYLKSRGLCPEFCKKYGVGYAKPVEWSELTRRVCKVLGVDAKKIPGKFVWPWGRIVFPSRDLSGNLTNLSARLVGEKEKLSPEMQEKFRRHKQRHLGGLNMKYFNPAGLRQPSVMLFESPLDALSFLFHSKITPESTGSYEEGVTSLFGLGGLKLEELPARVIFAFDNPERDIAAARKNERLVLECVNEGLEFEFVGPEWYGGMKDFNQALVGRKGIFSSPSV